LKRTLTATVLFVLASFAVAAVPPGTDDQISKRTQPVGSVCRAGDACAGGGSADVAGGASSGTKNGKEVYDTYCFACHATGMSEAPKLGDAQAWAPRVAQGMDQLLANTINGLNVMPPKGTCMACTDAELEATVSYMVESSP